MHEAQMHEDNCFITLTFASFSWLDNRHHSGSDLRYEEFQKFMKRLRKRFPDLTIRFYMAGEYGEQFGRPHFHACIFGLNFPDRDYHGRTPSGAAIYRSKILEQLWPFGFSSVGELTYESAAYVARYVMKKMTGDAADTHYEYVDPSTGDRFWRQPEFNKMSLKPGIGASWFEKYKASVFPHDNVIVNGKPVSVPRYYDKLLERSESTVFSVPVTLSNGAIISYEDVTLSDALVEIKDKRMEKAQLSVDDNTPLRLKSKEQVAIASLERLRRKLL